MTGTRTAVRRQLVRPDATLGVTVHPGTPPALVIVTGAMDDATNWAATVDAMPGGREVQVLDRRGRGSSSPQGDGYSVATEVDDLGALLDAIPGRKHLFGWSYGGLVAVEAARGRDDLVSLLAYEPVARPFARHAIAPIRDALAAGDTGRAVELVNTEVSGFSAAHVEALRAGPAWAWLCEVARPLAGELAAVDDFAPHYDDYPHLDVPVSLLIGERNLGGTEPYGASFDRFRRALPQASVTVLPGIGHLVQVEAPARLAEHLAAATTAAEG